MKKYIILAVVTAFFIGGLRLLPPMTEALQPEVEVVTTKTVPYMETLFVNGTVEPLRQKELSLRFPVVPAEICAQVGDTVNYGDVLATVDTEATKRAILSYAGEYADALPSGFLPPELETVMATVDADTLFEKLELPTKLLSPASGTLTALALHEGELFLPQGAAATVAALDPLQLRLAVNEGDIAKIHLNQDLTFQASAVEGGTFAAKIRRITPTAYQKLNGLTYETVVDVYATVADDFDVLRPGYSVRATIGCSEEEPLEFLPYDAILQDGNGVEYVYVYREGTACRRDIKTGAELSTAVAVTYGVGPYEHVILNASAIKKDGPVRLKSPKG